MADATVRALWRRFVSGKHLLEWETAADAERRAGTTTARVLARDGARRRSRRSRCSCSAPRCEPARALGGAAARRCCGSSRRSARGGSRSRCRRPSPSRSRAEDALALRRVARKTWRFFDTLRGAGGPLPRPRQLPGGPRRSRRVADLAHQHRPAAARVPRRLRPRLPRRSRAWSSASRRRSPPWPASSASAATSTTGTTSARWSRCARRTSRRWTRATSPATCSCCASACSRSRRRRCSGRSSSTGFATPSRLALEDLAAEQDRLGAAERVRRLHETLDEFERARGARRARPPSSAAGPRCSSGSAAWPTRRPAASPTIQLPTTATTSRDASLRLSARRCLDAAERLRASVADVAQASSIATRSSSRRGPRSLGDDAGRSARDRGASSRCSVHVPSLVGLAEGLVQALARARRARGRPAGPPAGWAARGRRRASATRVPRASSSLARLRLNADIAREMWEHTDFRMLYDPHRALFSIGYNLAEGRLDHSYYDLLASECRLASFLAVAKGDVDQEHWFRLGRSLTRTPQGRALVSWSASMFEYLMPLLVMRDWPETLLDRDLRHGRAPADRLRRASAACRGASRRAPSTPRTPSSPTSTRRSACPGSASSAACPTTSSSRRTPRCSRCRSTRAAVVGNLRGVHRRGRRGAATATTSRSTTRPGRVPAGSSRAVVQVVLRPPPGHGVRRARATRSPAPTCRTRFHADPMVASAELLLQERVPRHVQLVSPHVEEVRRSARCASCRRPSPAATRSPTRPSPRRTSCPTAATRSWSPTAAAATRAGEAWRSRATARTSRATAGARSSTCATSTPARSSRRPTTRAQRSPTTTTSPSRPTRPSTAARDGELETHGRGRRSRPKTTSRSAGSRSPTTGARRRRLEVTSYFEIALTAQAADQAHKSFSNLFVETEAAAGDAARCCSPDGRAAPRRSASGASTSSRATRSRATGRSRPTARAFLGRLRGVDDAGSARGARAARRHRRAPCSTRAAPFGATIEVPPGQTVRVVYATGVADEREAAVRLTEKYHDVAQRAARRSTSRGRPRSSSCATSASARAGGRARAARLAAAAHRPVLAAQGQDAGRERAADVGAVVDRHLGRPADPARPRRGARARAARAPGAARAPVLAPQGARRRPRHPEHAADRVRRRARRPAAPAAAHRPRAADARQARRRVPAPRRPDAPRRAQPPALGRARDPRRRRRLASSCSSTGAGSVPQPPGDLRPTAEPREYPPRAFERPQLLLRQRAAAASTRRPAST